MQAGQGSGQPRQDHNPQSLALNVTSESSFDHGANNKSADAAPTDQPKSRYKCKFLHPLKLKKFDLSTLTGKMLQSKSSPSITSNACTYGELELQEASHATRVTGWWQVCLSQLGASRSGDWLIKFSRLSLLFWFIFLPNQKASVSKFFPNLDLVLESGIAMSMKDHHGTDMSDSIFYAKENGIRMRGKKFQG